MSSNKNNYAKKRDISLRVAEEVQIDVVLVENIVNLLENDNTVPFIARYRRNETRNLEVDKIRGIKEVLSQVKVIETRKETVLKAIGEKVTPDIKKALKDAKTLQDVEDTYGPFKTGGKGTLANRARALGLDKAVEMIHNNPKATSLDMFTKPAQKGLSSIAEVRKGVQHILADEISKNKDIWDILKDLFETKHITLESKVSKNSKDDQKYKEYHQKTIRLKFIKAHQVLALNRAEGCKIVQVKINHPHTVTKQFLDFAKRKCIRYKLLSDFSRNLMEASLNDCLNRLLLPKIVRHKRAEITKNAEIIAVQVFTRNLRRLLLTPPVRNRTVLGIDPGFTHGCKLAVVDSTGGILDTTVIYPFSGRSYYAEKIFEELLKKHNCYTIALGNGKACRETECFISNLKGKGRLNKYVVYSIVSEDGASIYSVCKEAEAEMPQLDVNLRSAVSIARRLQNPLLEYIKIDPKHLGIGMYQHDMPEHLLNTALNGVLEDCMSLVGVDINTAGVHVLRLIAGLNERRANAIVEWREKNGQFFSRQQLKQVTGIGEKTFEQCAGFIRIMSAPPTELLIGGNETKTEQSSSTNSKEEEGKTKKRKAGESTGGRKKRKCEIPISYNRLDATCIHPESYPVAEKLMAMTRTEPNDIGQPRMKDNIDNLVRVKGLSSICETLQIDTTSAMFIINGLCQSLGHDLRADFAEPLFRRSVLSINDITPKITITGRVTNVTTFGAFVDIGVEFNGLIHVGNMPGCNPDILGAGDIVEVSVESINTRKKKISLQLLTIKNRNVEIR